MTGSYDLAFRVASVPIVGGAVILFLVPWAQKTASSTNIMKAAKKKETGDYDLTDDQEINEFLVSDFLVPIAWSPSKRSVSP